MEKISLPSKIEYLQDQENKNKGQFIIESCWPGYGATWGNALRRVLLSSLDGAAVEEVKIKGAKHEFSTLPYIKEDLLEIILNLKQLRFKIYPEVAEPIYLTLKVDDEKKVKASDIKVPTGVEIANPDLHIASLTDKKAKLEMEILIGRGRGYLPSEEKSRKDLDVGMIVTDSFYSPVVNVAIDIANTRVGRRTDFDKLILTVETDGTISPLEAVNESLKILAGQFQFLNKRVEEILKPKEIVEKPAKKRKITEKTKKVKKTKIKK